MTMQTPEHAFRSSRSAKVDHVEQAEPLVLTEEDAMQTESIDEKPAPADTAERFLLCTKTDDMAEKVRRAIGENDDVVIDLAGQSLIEMAGNDLSTNDTHYIIVVEIDPADPTEMAALRSVTSRAAESARFLAITPQELTISVARELMEAGVQEVLPTTALRDTQNEPQPAVPVHTQPADLHSGMVLTIAQTRGGIGATTLAINLASMLSAPKSRRDKSPVPKVALLDLDFQNGDAATSIDIEDNGVLIELLRTQGKPDAAFLRKAMVSYKGQFDVLPAPVEFAPFDALSPEMVVQLISELRKEYDYVILGLPRSMVLWLAPVLAHTDQMLLVTDTSVPGVRQARRLIDFYTEDNPGLPLDIVVSREKKPTSLPKSVKEAAKFLEKPFDIWLPADSRTAGKASERGVPMAEVSKRSPTVKSIHQIVNKMSQSQASDRRRKA